MIMMSTLPPGPLWDQAQRQVKEQADMEAAIVDSLGIENKEQGRPVTRPHLWSMENIKRNGSGLVVEYDLRCKVCPAVRHVSQPAFDLCPE